MSLFINDDSIVLVVFCTHDYNCSFYIFFLSLDYCYFLNEYCYGKFLNICYPADHLISTILVFFRGSVMIFLLSSKY